MAPGATAPSWLPGANGSPLYGSGQGPITGNVPPLNKLGIQLALQVLADRYVNGIKSSVDPLAALELQKSIRDRVRRRPPQTSQDQGTEEPRPKEKPVVSTVGLRVTPLPPRQPIKQAGGGKTRAAHSQGGQAKAGQDQGGKISYGRGGIDSPRPSASPAHCGVTSGCVPGPTFSPVGSATRRLGEKIASNLHYLHKWVRFGSRLAQGGGQNASAWLIRGQERVTSLASMRRPRLCQP